MNCRSCGYLLFGLSAPRCPECGLEFDVTTYCFAPNAVHFLCPHCRQGYYGNDALGLPAPRNFQCAKCGRHVAAAGMIVRPVRAGARGEPLRFGNTWEHRQQIGHARAFVLSLAELWRRPGEFYRLAYASDRKEAMTFAVGCAYLAAAACVLAAPLVGAAFGRPIRLSSLADPRALLLLFLIVPVVTIVWVYSYAILARLTLACLRTPTDMADFDHTLHAIAYATAAAPALFVPGVGLCWYVAVATCGLRHLHELSLARAAAAAAIPIILAGGVLAAIIVHALM